MSRVRWMVLPVLAVAVIGCTLWWVALQHWLAHQTGSLNSPGTPPNYNFYSGTGSILIPPLLDGLVFALLFWWHHQCHVSGCLWYARRTTAAGERACWRHHPQPERTHQDVLDAHHAATEDSSEGERM